MHSPITDLEPEALVNSIARGLPVVVLIGLTNGPLDAQEPYRSPPPDVVAIVDAPPTPVVRVSPDGSWLAVAERSAYPSIAQLAEPALGLAGIRFNPRTDGNDQPPLGTGLTLIRIEDGRAWGSELPEDVQLTYPFWSPDGSHIAFTNTTDEGVELWVASVDSKRAERLTGPELMAAWRSANSWLSFA